MKKYRHIPTGITALESVYKDNNYIIDFTNNRICPTNIHSDIVENGSDWKQIFDPNWQILSFRGKLAENKGLFTMCNDGKYRHENWEDNRYPYLSLKDIVENDEGLVEIYSVKRLSDGKIFTLNDLISKFEIQDIDGSKKMMATYDKDKLGKCDLDNFQNKESIVSKISHPHDNKPNPEKVLYRKEQYRRIQSNDLIFSIVIGYSDFTYEGIFHRWVTNWGNGKIFGMIETDDVMEHILVQNIKFS